MMQFRTHHFPKTMSTWKTILLLVTMISTLLTLSACNEGSPVESSAELVVVRAYLYAGEKVSDIQLSHSIPLSSGDSLAPPINDATVSLTKSGQTYQLTCSPGDSGYYHYGGNDLQVNSGDVFSLEVLYHGKRVTSSTQVPPSPEAVTISSDKLIIPSGSDLPFFRLDTNRIIVEWSNPTSDLYYAVLENIETNPEQIFLNNDMLNRARGRFISPPTQSNRYSINILSLTYYGRHSVKIYRINREYANLYQSRQQNTRDLNEPLTNINNGLGVFSAFNGVGVQFTVIKK
ncbi:MAG: DUF4249 family protein [bacterium]